MEYTILGNGIHMPLFGLGTWDLRGLECVRTVQKSAEYGYRLIGTAQMYGNDVICCEL